MEFFKLNDIQEFIVKNIHAHPRDIGRITAEHFKISRPTAVNYLKSLMENGMVEATGKTKARIYVLKPLLHKVIKLPVPKDLNEGDPWDDEVAPLLRGTRENVNMICYTGFTEMFNNVIDHSGSDEAEITVNIDAASITLEVRDFGVGIFNKIQQYLKIDDPKLALLELSKGKFTTAKEKHAGEGIFFTSRMFDEFILDSDGLIFRRRFAKSKDDENWALEEVEQKIRGTRVIMKISQYATHTTTDVYAQYTSEVNEDRPGLTTMHVPLALAVSGGDHLVSRSQAKRLLDRAEQFKEVILDFNGITAIGQGFADEAFRVFPSRFPHVKITAINTNIEIARMIKHVLAGSESIEKREPTLTIQVDSNRVITGVNSSTTGGNVSFIWSIPDEKKSSS